MTYEAVIDALANSTRRAIVERLKAGPCAAGELASALPVSQPAVSQHLGVLKTARLVRETRAGTRRIYRLDPDGMIALRAWLDGFWNEVLQSYREALEKDEPTS